MVVFTVLEKIGCGVGVPGVRVLARSRSQSLSFEGYFDSGLCLFHLNFCVILLQSV